MTPPLLVFLSLYLNTSSPDDDLSPLSLSSSLLSLTCLLFSSFFFHSSLRLLVRTCVHHQRILATCYLITRARPTLRTSLAEQTRVKHQSACYATKANHTTRTIQHGEREELIQSLTEALFTWKESKADKSNMTKNKEPEAKWRGYPKSKNIC